MRPASFSLDNNNNKNIIVLQVELCLLLFGVRNLHGVGGCDLESS